MRSDDFAKLITLDVIISKASGVSPDALFLQLENRLASSLTGMWTSRASTAVSRATATFGGGGSKAAVLRAVAAPFAGLANAVSRPVEAVTRTAYREGKREMLAKALARAKPARKAKPRSTVEIESSLTLRDERAIESMVESQLNWIGDFYDSGLSESIDEIVSEAMLESGLGREAAGKLLQEKLAERLTASGIALPTGMVNKPASYFEMLAANVTSSARVRGQMSQMLQIGVTNYTIVAAGDEKTCKRCVFMDGRSFQVQHAQKALEALEDADTPDKVRAAHPWASKVSEMEDAPGKFPLPPFHGACRCVVDISEDAELTFEPIAGWG